VSRDDTVDPGLPTPAYSQLEALLRRRIETGEWRTGPLPSVAYLQHEYGVGRDTVLHALRVLREAGLIFTVPKRGSYVVSHDARGDEGDQSGR
jgi:DNA-binding GntR family transcriptional regulator